MSTEEEIYLFSKRNEEESIRLRRQHKVLTSICGGHIISGHLPKEHFNCVADVATGTGIWIIEASQQLGSARARHRKFTGFDLSAEQFPAQPPTGVDFVKHDALKPFPEEHLGRYDLVNMRLLVVAIPTALLPKLLANVVALLKPGGYIQWMEPNFIAEQEQVTPDLTEFVAILLQFCRKFNFSERASDDVERAVRAAELDDIRRIRYTSRGRKELDDDVCDWVTANVRLAVPPSLLRNGEVNTIEEGRVRAEAIIEKIRGLHAQGEDYWAVFDVVTARKP